ncbi:hypothetical protein A2673_03165 [Candidatus Kaiserbacteria bacterium RIFCSPHIGHO2_01_FULL_50_13]|uniref:Ribosome-binding factor A n=1 Tax=Candidatus Kaiserbacteria bacterium RIFCSPLOWO2_01_FULL_50_24 TaxID=1798507 RepID=A0A1F6EIP8_9BACT|nr:MAG: hypothetical protein A2673_03165 [Candidatus Kaiserbacteria bacterium RIFCSPHIGHO2_01_FULL_50_13]OGG73509.1 MAG: hypothetical protein A3A34_01005 [Candidatus Kaiserbacteria bacterium RIFCSPLOWO2_01_FULL_50_24]OGG81558.1 MAG: hypothetical protein A3H74_00540 [Candidatus Kaiserbacteria bacterium RIFCSPLOWO2_02_FULL_51_13]
MSRRQQKVTEEMAHRASEYMARELGVRALVTVTRAEMSTDLKRVVLFLSVLPESKEMEVLKFAKRERSNFRAHLTEHSKIRPVPFVDFIIDEGEKNRRRVEELIRKKNE